MFFRNVHFRKLVKVSWNYIKTLLYVTMREEEVNHKLPLTLLQRFLVNSLIKSVEWHIEDTYTHVRRHPHSSHTRPYLSFAITSNSFPTYLPSPAERVLNLSSASAGLHFCSFFMLQFFFQIRRCDCRCHFFL